jgi:hypothetical protein
MPRFFRASLIVLSLLAFAFAAGLYGQQPWATGIWLWPEAPRLSNIFIASIVAAVAAPILWIGVSGEIGASRAGALNLVATFTGLSIYLFQQSAQQGDPRTSFYAAFFAAGVVANLGVYLYTRRIPIRDPLPVPTLLRWSFAAFALILIPVGLALLRSVPNVFPWPLASDMSVVYGWIFLGASVYFIHGFLWPSWQNAKGQLLGFLVYDLVLIESYLAHWQHVRAENRLSLLIYLAVITYSGLLAIYYLAVNPATGFRTARSRGVLARPSTLRD